MERTPHPLAHRSPLSLQNYVHLVYYRSLTTFRLDTVDLRGEGRRFGTLTCEEVKTPIRYIFTVSSVIIVLSLDVLGIILRLMPHNSM